MECLDAHADESGVVVGGWWPRANEKKSGRDQNLPVVRDQGHPRECASGIPARRQGASCDCHSGSIGLASGPPGFRSGPRTERHEDSHPSPCFHGQPRGRQTDDDPFLSLSDREGARSGSGVQRVRMEAQWTPRDRGGRPIKPPNGRLRSRERGEGGLRGSELVRDASAAGKRSELPRGEAKRSATTKRGGAALEQEEEEEGREAEVQGEMVEVRRGKARRRKGPREQAVLQSLAVVKAQGAIFTWLQFSWLLKPPIFRTRFQCEGSLAIFAVAESRLSSNSVPV